MSASRAVRQLVVEQDAESFRYLAVCDDGTIWETPSLWHGGADWKRLPAPPAPATDGDAST